MKKIVYLFLLTQIMVSAFSQNAVSLDTGFSGGVKYFEAHIAKGTKLVVLNFRSPSPQLSEYIMEELTVHFVDSGHFVIVDRSNLELIQQEMRHQLSGEVSDETALTIGKQLGAHTIVSGSVESFGDIFRLRIRAIAVESAAIQGIYTANIQKDRFLANLLGSSQDTPSQPPPTEKPTSSKGSQSGNTGNRVILPDYLLSK